MQYKAWESGVKACVFVPVYLAMRNQSTDMALGLCPPTIMHATFALTITCGYAWLALATCNMRWLHEQSPSRTESGSFVAYFVTKTWPLGRDLAMSIYWIQHGIRITLRERCSSSVSI